MVTSRCLGASTATRLLSPAFSASFSQLNSVARLTLALPFCPALALAWRTVSVRVAVNNPFLLSLANFSTALVLPSSSAISKTWRTIARRAVPQSRCQSASRAGLTAPTVTTSFFSIVAGSSTLSAMFFNSLALACSNKSSGKIYSRRTPPLPRLGTSTYSQFSRTTKSSIARLDFGKSSKLSSNNFPTPN